MIDAFQRIVLDDAPPEQRLGAVTLSELRESQVDEFKAAVMEQIAPTLVAGEVSLAEAQTILAKVARVGVTVIYTNIEKLKLRLQGREPMH